MRDFKVLFYTIISLVGYCGFANSILAQELEQKANAEQLKKAFFEDCLETSKDKYELYKNCIGKFTKECIAHPEKYEDKLKGLAFANSYQNCALLEHNLWNEIFEKYSNDLQQKANDKLIGKRKRELRTSLSSMSGRSIPVCNSMFTNWEEKSQGQKDNELECFRDVIAENAIMVYLWDNEFKIWENIK
ncbi:MAG: hypothetical protein ABL857_00320 [Rickettsiales bacterium]